MCSNDCTDGLRSWAWSRGNKELNKLSTKPPYSANGGRTYSLARKSTIHVLFSQSRNVQPLSYEPEYSLLISSETRITVQSPSTEVLANRLIGTCARCNPLQNTTSPVHFVPRLSHWSTIPQVLPPMNSFVPKTNSLSTVFWG